MATSHKHFRLSNSKEKLLSSNSPSSGGLALQNFLSKGETKLRLEPIFPGDGKGKKTHTVFWFCLRNCILISAKAQGRLRARLKKPAWGLVPFLIRLVFNTSQSSLKTIFQRSVGNSLHYLLISHWCLQRQSTAELLQEKASSPAPLPSGVLAKFRSKSKTAFFHYFVQLYIPVEFTVTSYTHLSLSSITYNSHLIVAQKWSTTDAVRRAVLHFISWPWPPCRRPKAEESHHHTLLCTSSPGCSSSRLITALPLELCFLKAGGLGTKHWGWTGAWAPAALHVTKVQKQILCGAEQVPFLHPGTSTSSSHGSVCRKLKLRGSWANTHDWQRLILQQGSHYIPLHVNDIGVMPL